MSLRKDSDSLDVRERAVAADFDGCKLVRQLREAYRRAPHFEESFPVVETAILSIRENLFEYIHDSVDEVRRYLRIGTPIVVSSSLEIDPTLKDGTRYSPCAKRREQMSTSIRSGGRNCIPGKTFFARGIELKFLQTLAIEYRQFGEQFVPLLSIIDVMMFNPSRGFGSFSKLATS